MADDIGGNVAAEQFGEYLLKCGALLLHCDGGKLEEFLAETSSQSAVETFAKGEDSTFILEIQSPIKSIKSADDDKKREQEEHEEKVALSTTFGVFSEIPASAFDSISSEYEKKYLLFMKINDVGPLQDDRAMQSQIMISTFNPAQPFQSMIPYIRHTFVPIATLRAQREEKQQSSASASRGLLSSSGQSGRVKSESATKGILDKLRELELKLLESQDEAQIPDVHLEPVSEINKWLESLSTDEKQSIIDFHIKGKSTDIEVPPYLKEQKVLNQIQRKLRSWKDDITSVVRRNRGSSSRTTVQQEIKFWKAKLTAIEQVESELKTDGVCASTMVLMKNNLMVQARAFLNQVQIKESKKEVALHNEVLSTFPIKQLVTSSSVQDIIRAINEIFQHLDAFKNKNNYPVERIAILARAAARDVSNQLREVLSRKIMTMKYSVFTQRTASTERLFHNFQNKYTKLRSDLRQRELLDRQRNFSGPWHRDQETDLNQLQKRVESIKKIRKGHAEIEKVIDSTFASSTDKDTLSKEISKIDEAYAVFKKLDVLSAPIYQWEQCVSEYESAIQEVENEIQQMIRHAMENANDPREMFRVCEKYNKLFVRDRIRNAVWEFQEELLKNVQEEIKQLQLRYRQRYSKIPASRLSLLRDIPAVSGEVIWCKQLKRQLDQNEKRLEAVLGDNWKNRGNAKDLAEQMNSFAKKLDPMILVKQWENDAKSLPNFDDQAPIFKIDRGVNKSLSLTVAFDENYVKLFKEVRCLLSLGIRIDIALRLSCIDVKQKYPIAVKLKEAVSIFSRTCIEIDQYSRSKSDVDEEKKSDIDDDVNRTMLSQLTSLVDQYKYQCQQQILDGAKHRWQNHEKQLNKYVASLSKATIALQDKTQKAYDLSYDTDRILQELRRCPLIKENITVNIEKLQKIVNKLDDGGFYGVPYWTSILNKKLEVILLKRVDEILDQWVGTLDEDWDILKSRLDDDDMQYDAENIFLRKEAIKHTIKLNNNLLKVYPSIPDAKMILGQDLQSFISMIVEQSRPKSDLVRSVDDDDDDDRSGTFRSILEQINTEKIIACYAKIEEITTAANEYAQTWLSYQALYDMDINKVFEELGDDIGKWKRLLIDMKASAASFDSGDVEKSFGPIVIHFGSVRNKVDEKYRNFRQQTFKSLKTRLGQLLRDFHNRATRGKHELEETSFETSTTKEIVSAITSLQNLRTESSTWDELWTECEAAEKLLVQNRYNLGATWMYASRVRGVLNDFFQVLDMRWNALKQEATTIYSKLEERNDTVVQSVSKLEEKWHVEKPTEGWASTWTDEEIVEWLKDYEGGILRPMIDNFRSKSADGRVLYALSKMEGARLRSSLVRILEISSEVHQNNLIAAMQQLLFTHADVHNKLQQFGASIALIEEQYEEIHTAKTAMSVVVEGVGMDDGEQIKTMLDNITKEMEGLSEVHRALTVQWEKLQKIGKDQFMRLDTRELGKTLRGIEEELSHLPNKMKTYQVYGKFMEIVKLKKKMNKNILGDLNAGGVETPILRQKHWRELFQLLGIKKSNANQLTVDDLWSINLLKYLNEIRAICLVAQGENALENFLGELNDKWQDTFFELVDYKGKCSLVKNWNDLMADIADSLSDVMSMKQSPYFKSFERDSIQWEEKLNSATAIFDVMVDVQRRWVYLQGVFTNSEDVKRQLGGFYQKFKAFDREFLQLMKGIKGDPLVDHWVSPEQGLLKKLETNQNTLNQIQKALNEYLESQRALFARFYFIGDDDLLEIIGNSRDPLQMNRHLSKMFAGITQLQIDPNNEQVVVGMTSKEGESVGFREPVDVSKSPKIQEWLTSVEFQMRVSLASLLGEAIESQPPPSQSDAYFAWCRKFPAQVALLATQVRWSEAVEANLRRLSQDQSDESHEQQVVLLELIKATLTILADRVLMNVSVALRKLYEQLITELVYQRDVTRNLIKDRICSEKDFSWLYRMRFYWNKSEKDVLKKLQICISRAKFYYGFEYFGATERLVQTPLTDKAYLTLCEALHAKLGGNPFGPAGTGKTESVKSLGAQLGRFVLVFCCDENFDYAAMSRIFIGLCQCGAWGCFDEFNRLEEKILSAVSQQILTIQEGLKVYAPTILIREQACKLNQNMGIFVTMNPGYAGRSELPDNLKQLFRGMAMIKPNRVLIAQVMLFSQGFTAAELLSTKIVLLFELCRDQLSKQSHYDFGLRALKSVLRSAGNLKRSEQKLKRAALAANSEQKGDDDEKKGDEPDGVGVSVVMTSKEEETILIRSLMSTVVPKLVMNDKFLFDSLLDSAFPGADIQGFKEEKLKAAIKEVAAENNLRLDAAWLVKLMQFHTIQNITHGVMLVGPSGAGKTAARNTLLAAMEICDGIKSEQYEIDPKAIAKEQLYGTLDATTLEWTDGVFTGILRTIIDNVRGEANRRHWIVFDGDVDPEWAENLNSVLDDNMMLTLPNGERLALTPNIRIIFETPTLYYATPATVSRCGMVWFSEECVTTAMLFDHMIRTLRTTPILQSPNRPFEDWEDICGEIADYITPFFMDDGGLVIKILIWAEKQKHVMKFTRTKSIYTLFSQLRGGCTNILEYNENTEYQLNEDQMTSYYGKFLLSSLLWAFGGPMKLDLRYEFGKEILNIAGYMDTNIELPNGEILIDYEVNIEEQSWVPWNNRVNNPELEPQKIKDPTVVINTIDTIRHEEVIRSWLADVKPVILCGPPGSGKSMTLSAVLRANPQYEMITLNFSSSAGTELIFKAFEQYCKIERKNQGYCIRPTFQNKTLVIFCDEINLPAQDLYGTQTIITFLRQLICKNGYWHPINKNWISLENIQFVGACNPPTDAGRVVLSPRFLNQCPLILVDFPGRESLLEIYGSFIRALLKLTPSIRQMADNVTTAMVDVYQNSQKRFNTDIQAHYVYSPRELSRWTRAMYRALAYIEDVGGTTAEEIVRLWAHEALRLFSDRLVDVEERKWTQDMINEVAQSQFSQCNLEQALVEPILYSDYLSKNYVSVDKHALKDYILQRLKVFNEEELDVQLVIYDELLDHILRIDRVLRQPLGHLLMVGASGAGKTVFSRFVSWLNGMTTFQIKVHKDYTAEDFDIDLRAVLIQSGVEQQKMTFIFDESNILDTAFLERMNALLASGEVPGLFEDAEYMQLIMKLREAARKDGLIIDTEEELYQMFTTHVQNNLHIVFTMNPAGGDFSDRAATSPALFNRCVINWWGTWPDDALLQVAAEFTESCDLNIGVPPELRTEEKEYKEQEDGDMPEDKEIYGVHLSVSQTIVQFHKMVEKVMEYLANQMVRSTFVTPRHYLDLIHHFVALFDEKRTQLEDQQKHLNTGLKALRETEEEVARRQVELDAQAKELNAQQKSAKETLEQMMVAEKDASKKRKDAIRVAGEVEVEMKQINERTSSVESELAEAKPALEAAQKAVSNINKRQLNEIKALRNPPQVVDMTMRAVGTLMGKKIKDWKSVQKMLGQNDFIPEILKFDTNKVKQKVRNKINKEYMSNEEFTFERVNKASKVAGPLVLWVKSQVKFAHLLDSVEPMTREIKELKEKLMVKQKQSQELSATVIELEKKIEEYKSEYQRMVQKITELKNEMAIVEESMARARKLLEDLSDENSRWQQETENFQKQLSTLDGDCLLAAGFLTYIGFYSQTFRQILISKWKEILEENGLPYNDMMELVVYLSSPAERIEWKAAYLPEDDLCVENAIILKRFNRYPLIIDPSGQATKFIMANYKKNKIVRTSFLDSAFTKNLESGLRFGNALLIEDVENMDPILNPVLNKEYQTVGGRRLVKLANKEIDFSPTFTMFLVTRDPLSSFTPDLCSRVTFVNFSVTPSSLQSQCLNKILKVEAPDIEKKRNDQLRLQGEFKFQLRELEDQLLDALNSATGNILEDKQLMSTLENLKLKAKVIGEKAQETEKVLAQVEEASYFYTPFAKACSKLYFSLENLANVHFLYQFDLRYFLGMTEFVLKNGKKGNLPELQELKEQELDMNESKNRLVPLMKALHRITYIRTKRALRVADANSWGLRVAQVFLDSHPDSEFTIKDEYLQYILKGKGYKDGKMVKGSYAKELELTSIGASLLGALYTLSGFENLQDEIETNLEEWKAYKSGPAEAKVPGDWNTGESVAKHQQHLESMVIQKPFRPDQMIRSSAKFIESVFGWNLAEFEANASSLRHIVEFECDAETPILMASTPGNDPSTKIDTVAAEVFEQSVSRKYASFALGSPKDYDKADNAITQATKKGTWVCLKNVHLSPEWLQTLEKRLHRLKKDPAFRLFMTMEIHPKVPVTLLRKSSIIIYEPPLGIKASLQRTFNSVDGERVDRSPEERSRLYILLAWLHAVILERLRFCPIGWSKAFEFSETDLFCAMDAMDEWIDKITKSRSNISPNEIPWDALHKMLVQYVYGGRVDNKYDTARLTAFVKNLFNPEAFNDEFALASLGMDDHDDGKESGVDLSVGRLGYVCPIIKTKETEKEILARIVQVDENNNKLKIVFLETYVVFGKERINLNATENWISSSSFRIQSIKMAPVILVPKRTKYQDIRKWVLETDEVVLSNPAIVGLPPRAELMILAARARSMCSQLLSLQDVETGNAMEELTEILNRSTNATQNDDEDLAGASIVPQWMLDLRNQSAKWLENVPQNMEKLVEKSDSIKNPLFRFMRREFAIGSSVLNLIFQGLSDLIAFVDGEIKATNDLRRLVSDLSKELVPKRWNLYTMQKLGVSHWILDFVKRIEQLNSIAQCDYVTTPSPCRWLGGLFSPAGFIAATRQYVSNDTQWPLERLILCVEIGEQEWLPHSFIFEGVTLYGAGWDKESGCLVLTEKTATSLPPSRFIWRNDEIDHISSSREWTHKAPKICNVMIPVYLNASFMHLLFDVSLPVFSALPVETWVQRSVSLSVWSN